MMQQATLPSVDLRQVGRPRVSTEEQGLRESLCRAVAEGGRRSQRTGQGDAGSLRSTLYLFSVLGTLHEEAMPRLVLRRARRLNLVQAETGGMLSLTKLGKAVAAVLEYV